VSPSSIVFFRFCSIVFICSAFVWSLISRLFSIIRVSSISLLNVIFIMLALFCCVSFWKARFNWSSAFCVFHLFSLRI